MRSDTMRVPEGSLAECRGQNLFLVDNRDQLNAPQNHNHRATGNGPLRLVTVNISTQRLSAALKKTLYLKSDISGEGVSQNLNIMTSF